MFPLVTYGITDASTTRSPSTPCTRMLPGSTTAISSVPILQVQDGCRAVSPSLATQARISSSLDTDGPGEISPSLYGASAGWFSSSRATRIDSTHSRRSCSVDR